MNPIEEKERRPIPTMQASRDVHSNSSSILLNTTCISPSAGPTGSRPQNVVILIKVLECMWVLLGVQWLSGRVLDSRPKGSFRKTRSVQSTLVDNTRKRVWQYIKKERRAEGLSLTGATALWSLSKTHLS